MVCSPTGKLKSFDDEAPPALARMKIKSQLEKEEKRRHHHETKSGYITANAMGVEYVCQTTGAGTIPFPLQFS